MRQQWVGMPPDGTPVQRVCGVCFDAEDRVLALRVGMRLTLPATGVHGAEDPGAALAAWLAQRGVHVHRSGPLTYRIQPASAAGPAYAVAYRAAIAETGGERTVPVPRYWLSLSDAAAVSRLGPVRIRLAARAARRMREEPMPDPPVRRSVLGRHARAMS